MHTSPVNTTETAENRPLAGSRPQNPATDTAEGEPTVVITPRSPSGDRAGTSSSRMQVEKRGGRLESVDVTKIVRAVERSCGELDRVDSMRIATRTISGLYDGATTAELDRLSIQTASSLIAEEPQYSKLAARLLATYIDKEVRNQDIHSFSQAIRLSHENGLLSDEINDFVQKNRRKLNDAIETGRNVRFEYLGLRTVYDRYLLVHPVGRKALETPQYFFMRVACGLSKDPHEAIEFYRLISSLEYLPSSPTLFNSASMRSQLSSCYLLDSPEDDLISIYDRYSDVAKLSKYAGGIGLAYHRIRAKGSLIRGTNGHSNGIVPWLKTLDSSVAAVNQGGRRKGACCVYLESWHADIEEFLELRDNTGDEARRTHNINLANWIPDLFMHRVKADDTWSLFDPKVVPNLCDLYGEEFDKAYLKAEAEGLFVRQVSARELYAKMMRSLAQTGNGWMTYKDAANEKCNQTGKQIDGKNPVVHLSNLCTEILEVTSGQETAVCNLGSINLGRLVHDGAFDFERLSEIVVTAVRFLDRVIDINFYPTQEAESSNKAWRPVGLGEMGLADVFFQLGLPFDSEKARELTAHFQEAIYFHAVSTSCDLAEKEGPHPNYDLTRSKGGKLQFDLWGVSPTDEGPIGTARWAELRKRVAKFGLRNSLLLAIAPTATISSIAGCYECIEPQVSNLFKRETLSGDFLIINRYLVADLQSRGLWTENIREKIKRAEGSIQEIEEIPSDLRLLYRTAWEIPMRSIIDMAAARGPYLDQSQSLNLFMETPTIGKLSSMYLYAWEKGLKTTYYLRSRPATRIRQTNVSNSSATSDSEAVACSLENPESCEACE
ncbi:MAG: ribonucleoside-diphosphate reductase subunit alpha [Planctomycetes bacterium]|nr:ribonucleoside-diphosphate reductase subunit alpha [Planctomycetota bacterium]